MHAHENNARTLTKASERVQVAGWSFASLEAAVAWSRETYTLVHDTLVREAHDEAFAGFKAREACHFAEMRRIANERGYTLTLDFALRERKSRTLSPRQREKIFAFAPDSDLVRDGAEALWDTSKSAQDRRTAREVKAHNAKVERDNEIAVYVEPWEVLSHMRQLRATCAAIALTDTQGAIDAYNAGFAWIAENAREDLGLTNADINRFADALMQDIRNASRAKAKHALEAPDFKLSREMLERSANRMQMRQNGTLNFPRPQR